MSYQQAGKRQEPDRYSQDRLINDGSIDFNELSRAEVDRLVAEQSDAPITRLLHTEVRYETTDHCNATCIMCPRDLHEHGREHGVMAFDEYASSIDEIVPMGARKVVLTGFGEPLMDSTLSQKVAYAHDRGLSTYLISNASLLDDKRARGLITAGLDELRVSVYGTRPETYNAVMKKLDFHQTIQNLMSFLKLREELGSKTPKLQVSYLVLKENEEDTDAFREYWNPWRTRSRSGNLTTSVTVVTTVSVTRLRNRRPPAVARKTVPCRFSGTVRSFLAATITTIRLF